MVLLLLLDLLFGGVLLYPCLSLGRIGAGLAASWEARYSVGAGIHRVSSNIATIWFILRRRAIVLQWVLCSVEASEHTAVHWLTAAAAAALLSCVVTGPAARVRELSCENTEYIVSGKKKWNPILFYGTNLLFVFQQFYLARLFSFLFNIWNG